jgi:chaperonin GroES
MDAHVKTRGQEGNLFSSYQQRMDGIDPAKLRPLFDRIIVRDVPDEEFSPAGIVLSAAPSLGGVGKDGRMRLGDVIAVGRGDPYKAWPERGKIRSRSYPNIAEMRVKPGDRCVIDRRKEGEIFIEGVRYTICSEYQAVYGRMVYSLRANLLEFECLYDRVLIEPVKIQSGIVLRPATARQEQFREGIVRAAGQGERGFDGRIHPLSVKPGNRVLFRAEGGGGAARAEEITLFGETLLIMREKLIWAVLD